MATDAYNLVEQQVIDDTGRPDKAQLDTNGSSIIMRRIRRAVLKMHRIDFWKKDFVEQLYVFNASGMIQAIDTALLPRLRAVSYIRKWDSQLQSQYQNNVTGAPKGSSFEEIAVDKMVDGYGYDRQDTMYRSGQYIKINASVPIDAVLIGWFQDPILDPIIVSDSWILANYPDLITAIVKEKLFKDIGKDDESRNSKKDYEEELLSLQTNNVRLSVM